MSVQGETSVTCRQTFCKINLSPSDRQLPPSIPLILPSNYEYDPIKNTAVKKRWHDGPVQLEIVPRSGEVLKNMESTKPLAVVSICGPYRSGKSYFLSRILNSDIPPVFKVDDGTNPCTHGIWMATTALECDNFILLLLDTEGVGAVNASFATTTKLLVITTLLSSYLIYNSKSVPKKKDLEQLQSFTHLSSYISQVDDDNCRQHFPNLLWLLRDVSLKFTDKADNPISPTEFLKTRILVRSNQPKPTLSDGVVHTLTTHFPSIECRALPPGPPDPVNLTFDSECQKVYDHLLKSIQPKQGFTPGSKIDGCTLAGLMEKYVSALNSSHGIGISLELNWVDAAMGSLDSLAQKLGDEYEKEMKAALKGKLPLEEGDLDEAAAMSHDVEQQDQDDTAPGDTTTLMAIHMQVKRSKIRELQKKADNYLPGNTAAAAKTIIEKLTKDIVEYETCGGKVKRVQGGRLQRVIGMNYAESKTYCETKFDEVCRPLHRNFDQPVESKRNEYFQKAVGPAKGDVWDEMSHSFDTVAPGKPHDLKVVGRGRNRVKLRWQAPQRDPQGVQYYEVAVQKSNDPACTWTKAKETKHLSALVTGLDSRITYALRVRGINKDAKGETSEEKAKTKPSAASRVARGVAAGVGGGLVAPATHLVGGAIAIHKGRNKELKSYDNEHAVKAGTAILGTTPLAVAAYPLAVVGTGTALGIGVYRHYESEGSLSDSDPESDGTQNEAQTAPDAPDGPENEAQNVPNAPDSPENEAQNVPDAPDDPENEAQNVPDAPDGPENEAQNAPDSRDDPENEAQNVPDAPDGPENEAQNAPDAPDGPENEAQNVPNAPETHDDNVPEK